MKPRNLIIFGASRGIGHGLACDVPNAGDSLWLVSRTRPTSLARQDGVTRHWLPADLSLASATSQFTEQFQSVPIHALIYNAGIWEEHGFRPSYRFEYSSQSEIQQILAVNLQGAILAVQALLANLRQAENAKVILIGSISGLDHASGVEVAYAASKFGLRGVAHALRQNLRPERIPVTLLNPGTVATELPYEVGAQGVLDTYPALDSLPIQDLVQVVRCVLALSPAACVKEINLPALGDESV
ncbi:MAG TPA: SDR family oxidoreductase [Anaerolineales bacterium]|nr:SDR family oxidoreductase [Anaerolineales bacterium]